MTVGVRESQMTFSRARVRSALFRAGFWGEGEGRPLNVGLLGRCGAVSADEVEMLAGVGDISRGI